MLSAGSSRLKPAFIKLGVLLAFGSVSSIGTRPFPGCGPYITTVHFTGYWQLVLGKGLHFGIYAVASHISTGSSYALCCFWGALGLITGPSGAHSTVCPTSGTAWQKWSIDSSPQHRHLFHVPYMPMPFHKEGWDSQCIQKLR